METHTHLAHVLLVTGKLESENPYAEQAEQRTSRASEGI